MGCLFAARFAKAGAQVTLVDVDAARMALISSEGLVLSDNDGTSQVPLKAVPAEEATGPVDLVLLFTKSLHSAAAARSVAHLAAQAPIATTLQNGLGNAEALAEVFGADRVLLGTAHVPARIVPPNRVISEGFSHVDFGGFTSAAQIHARPVADLLDRAGFSPTIRTDAAAAVWTKLAFNAALNPLALVARATNGEMNNEWGHRLAHAIARETVAVAAAGGIVLDGQEIVDTVDQALREHAGHKASMLQDFEAGRPTEIEFINGAVAREGARLGIATPVTEALADLVRFAEDKAARDRAAG
ncbi:MAG: 2-dehydropantoate 2-reductase [Candidatus Andeanibacterium colombiense]|uniref:2-dehydropantoate 2-reductase n=1 Tax=Candidatus Andeanibacterium colombiense TaxID=3121345 RepID=A0AAJ6BNS9_9SPHN|nr:MAG: 2-dehydropantoate 2-reductase [Sphingomonadaceae bacterium]